MERQIEMKEENKCRFPDGVRSKPDGVHELDPCIYELMEEHSNVKAMVYRCKKCGNIDISWVRSDDTEDVTFE